MAEKLTVQQSQAVHDRGGKLLVSAAAGSGKTKVLVDRLMDYLTDPKAPANLDEFLIITYTKAAASELRGKIASKLSEYIANDPENKHLQQQMQRLYLTNISTVHGFCADVLRQYAYQLDISADFRVADENECIELQNHVMQQVLERAYLDGSDDADFQAFIDTQGFGRDDRQIPEILMKVFHSAKCHLNPEQWLDWCLDIQTDAVIDDAAQTIWGTYLVEDLHAYLDLQILAVQQCASRAALADEMQKPAAILAETVNQLRNLRACFKWDDIRKNMHIDYGTLRFSPKCTDVVLIDQIKAVRESCKKELAKKLRRFSDSSAQVLTDLNSGMSAARGLVSLVKKFDCAFDSLKRSRRVLDFSDLEHKMLDLLYGKSRAGLTSAAREIGSRFREVMVDEYQDSNAVQDAIFSALTDKKQNCFMVGDVKQSIYQFRLADPGIFLEKYNTYVPAEFAENGIGRKVLLSSNFRSSGAVIKAVNDVFTACMSEQVGGLVYGEQEELKEGVPHVPMNDQEVELYGIQVREDTYSEEADFVAERIQQLLDGKHMVRHGDTLRPIKAEDIVILLRSPGSVGIHFQYALEQRGIPSTMGNSFDLLQTEEIQTLHALLQVINNPLQDIPLIAVLGSRIFGFTADDLAQIRSENKHAAFYDALCVSQMPKALNFVKILSQMRSETQMNSLSKLFGRIFEITKFDSVYASTTDGVSCVENIQAFCRLAYGYESATGAGLAQLLAHLDMVAERGITLSEDQSNAGAVTIMSIHKSKGLEFPVVFLCGLSRAFNSESSRAQVLCDKELGLGLACVDRINRVRYPTVAKRAISAKIVAESLSEEMRVLYVAMTRARDRLIMTYAAPKVEQELEDLRLRSSMSDPLLLTRDADCPGAWVLASTVMNHNSDLSIQMVQAPQTVTESVGDEQVHSHIPKETIERLGKSLSFRYAHVGATKTPSKQTATQLKGRDKDTEAAQGADQSSLAQRNWRTPSFCDKQPQGKVYGNAMHAVMQYIKYSRCVDHSSVLGEISRLYEERYISKEQAQMVDADKILAFFQTDIGKKLQGASQVLREFKFSILDDAEAYCPGVFNEKVILQGVVDCALIESDGITVLDFKTDRVSEATVDSVANGYKSQIRAYAKALERIYEMPVKSALLYFFHLNTFVEIK